jgi:geranylgeranyl diphosphate synthase type II
VIPFDLGAYLQQRREWVDEALDIYLPPSDQPPTRLHESMRYSVFCGGKRLRPILVLAGAEAVGGASRPLLPLACAVECIHTFSLIHDDLPAIDDDDLRRGSPTNHIVYGEAMAILAGDALLAMAFELIAECRLFYPADRVLDALVMVARASGTRGMVGGQVSDIECEGRDDMDESTVASIHARKTGALLLSSLLAGARLAGASIAEEEALRRYGREIGLAFQITDDILDLEGDTVKLGKPVGSDLRQDKATYPKILGIPASRRLAQEASESAVAALEGFPERADPLRALARYVVERES